MKSVENIDQRMVKALSHPLRMTILTALNEKVASPSELADELGEPLGNVSYHVRILADLGCIELVRTTPRRGAVEHHYRALTRPFFRDEDWSRLPRSTRRSVFDAILKEIWKDVGDAAGSGGLDDDRAQVSRTPLVLDRQGWEELADLLASVIERAFEIQAESADRLVDGPDHDEGALSTKLVLMQFEG
jgi:DNA-binding transcriptional ArsR family regulator